MQKGAPILRSALTGGLRLELTYRDPFAKERTDELQREEQARHNVELSTAADYDTSEGLQLTTHTWLPELSSELRAFPKGT
jgi:hypothetical protein